MILLTSYELPFSVTSFTFPDLYNRSLPNLRSGPTIGGTGAAIEEEECFSSPFSVYVNQMVIELRTTIDFLH